MIGFEERECTVGEESIQAASDFAIGLALSSPALDVALRLFVADATNQRRVIKRAIELAVTTSVEPMMDLLAEAGNGPAVGRRPGLTLPLPF